MNDETSPKANFAPIFLYSSLLVAVLVVLTLLARHFAVLWELSPAARIIFTGVLPAVIAIAILAALEKRLSGDTLSRSLVELGLGSPNLGQLRIAVICLAPIITTYFIRASALGIPIVTQPAIWALIIKFLVSQGVAEEMVFRGFVYRRLRPGRSFFHAATLSAITFSVIHLTGLLRGLSIANSLDTAFSIGFSFLMAYAMAALFERGRGTIWGCALLHVGIDSINWFFFADEATFGPGNVVYIAGIVASIGMVLWIVGREQGILTMSNKHYSRRTPQGAR